MRQCSAALPKHFRSSESKSRQVQKQVNMSNMTLLLYAGVAVLVIVVLLVLAVVHALVTEEEDDDDDDYEEWR